MNLWIEFLDMFVQTLHDVAPIIGMIFFFQFAIIRRPFTNFQGLLTGLFYVIIGMTLFLLGLEKALFPLGNIMATQLTDPSVTLVDNNSADYVPHWQDYIWVYIFGACVGFATALAEPALIAVAIKAEQISGGSINAWGLRIAVALGVSFGIGLGTFRIATGTELYLFIICGYVIVMIQTAFAPKAIIGLAYDSGGVSTSTVTVPIITALGLGLASAIPGRNPLQDGFGLIAFACLFPIIAVLSYAQLATFLNKLARKLSTKGDS